MTRIVAPAVSVCVLVAVVFARVGPSDPPLRGDAAAVMPDWGKVPLAFEPDKAGSFTARGPGFGLVIGPRRSVLRAGRGGKLVTTLVGARPSRLAAENRLAGVVNYYRGSDPRRWREGIPTYARVRARSVYPGIDLTYRGRPGTLEYDFELAPGADPAAIGLRLDGMRSARLDRRGDLLIRTRAGTVHERRPRAFQSIAGRRVPVRVAFRLAAGVIRFDLGAYDRSLPLVIDPVVSYSTFVPGSEGQEIAVDSPGASYIGGQASSNAFVAKLSADGTQFLYTTVFGGSSSDSVNGLVIDGSGQVYAVGDTSSSNFPHPSGADGTLNGPSDGFVAKLNAAGSITWARYYGGTADDRLEGVDIEGSNVHVVGTTSSASLGVGLAYQAGNAGFEDAIYARLNQSDNAVTYASYLGGTQYDEGWAIIADSGKATIAGATNGTGFPIKLAAGKGQSTFGGGSTDGFIAQFNPGAGTATTTLDNSTFYGGAGLDAIYGIAGSTGNVHAAGETSSSTGLQGNAGSPAYAGGTDAFVVTFSSGQTFTVGSGHYIGGTGRDRARAIAVDAAGADYITGDSASADFPRVNWPFDNGGAGDENVFFAKHGAGGAGAPVLQASGQIGGIVGGGDRGYGIAVDSDRSAYIAGYGQADFPTTAGAADTDADTRTAVAVKVIARVPTITEGPDGPIASTSATFKFTNAETNVNLECSVDSTTVFSSCAASKTYSPLSQGPHTFRLRSSDYYGAKSAFATRAFTVDTIAPSAFDLISPGDGEQTGTQPDFSWQPSTDATTAVRYAIVIDGAAEDVAATCTADTCSAKTAKTLVTGPHTWQVNAIDEAGNTTASATRGFTALDPPTARFTIAPNPALVGRNVTFDGSASPDATHQITKYEWDLDGDGTFESNGGTSRIATKAYSKAQTVNVGLRVTDSSGLTGTSTTKLTVTSVPGAAAQLGVTINNGAQYTKTPDVVINAVFPSSTTSMLFSNDGGFLKPEDFKPQAETKWKLDSSGPERLPKIVYVRFLTGPFVSETFTDDIILDETPPKVEQAAVTAAPAPGTAATAAAAKRTYKLKIKATDSNSGVRGVYVTANKKKPGKLLKYKRTIKVKATTRKLYVRARDKAGNLSRWRKAR